MHVECLERWLNESGRARCELCGYKYATKRVPRYGLLRSVVIWFHAVIATRQVRQVVNATRLHAFVFRALLASVSNPQSPLEHNTVFIDIQDKAGKPNA